MAALDGLVALVTGCGRLGGLGREIALALATAGSAVAVTDIYDRGTRNSGEPPETEEEAAWSGLSELGSELEARGAAALTTTGDVSIADDARRIVSEVIDRFGKIDILVNNAGAPQGDDRDVSWNVPESAFDAQLRVNTKGVFLMSCEAAKAMLSAQQPGRIINIASIGAMKGFAGMAAYCASKFAVLGLTQSMAAELAPHGITVNAVCPGPIKTARHAASSARAASRAMSGGGSRSGAIRPPVGRYGEPHDVARAVIFLSEPAASFITGEAIAINGGHYG